METLLLTHCEPGNHQHPFPVLDDLDEVVAGPRFKTVRQGGRLRFLNTPGARFALPPVLAAAGDWRPELVLVHADSTLQCLPSGLRALGVPRVLLVGDTHHLDAPLRSLISYAQEERFDHVVLWNRHHAHFFIEAGLRQVHWLPGLLFWIPPYPVAAERRAQVGFFGSMGRYHPRRRELVEALRAAGVPLDAGPRSRREGLRLLSGSAVGLNQSLNGEFNLRVLETMETGAVLLTDHLTPETGLATLFSEGTDFLAYRNIGEAVERARWALDHPADAAAVAAAGQRRCRELFSREARRQQLLDILTFADRDGLFGLGRESRCLRRVIRVAEVERFQERVMAYEFLQELHRVQAEVVVVGRARAHPEFAADCADLCRLRWLEPADAGADCAGAVGVLGPADPEFASWQGAYRLTFGQPSLDRQYGWKRLSPDLALYARQDEDCTEENIPGGWCLRWPEARAALVTLAIGEKFRKRFEEYYLPSWKSYARRHRIDLVVLTAPLDESPRASSRSPAWQKCIIGQHPAVAGYPRVAWVDADIVLSRTAPDLFAAVPPGEFGAVDMYAIDAEFPGTMARSAANYEELRLEANITYVPGDHYRNWGLPIGELGTNADRIVQTGLFVFEPDKHGALLAEVYRTYEDKGAAQWNFEMWPLSFELVKRQRIHWLDWRFNACASNVFCLVRDRYWLLFDGLDQLPAPAKIERLKEIHALYEAAYARSHFLHLAGMGNDVVLTPPEWRLERSADGSVRKPATV